MTPEVAKVLMTIIICATLVVMVWIVKTVDKDRKPRR